ncbi:MAG TPA: cytochrome c-type biogenesis protein CcmH, partial [Longimicrobiaceae bacterium]|nr:cytochrome c-type biogenesis protein CcmH [Longimicrobiaceae bacterium]
LLVVAHAAPLRAQDVAAVSPETERVAQAAMSQLRSPVTPFHTLDMCPDAAAAALRDTLRADAARGLSASQIVEATIARRGEELRIVPRRSGVGLWAWLAPPAVLLAGLFAVGGWLRRSKANGAAEPTPEALSSEDRELLAAEMAEWDREPEEDR